MRNDIDKLTLNALRKIRRNNPEIIYQEIDGEINYRNVTNFTEIKSDLHKWKQTAIDNLLEARPLEANINSEYIPEVIGEVIINRLQQVEDREGINSVLEAVIFFFDKEREKEWHKKIPPYEGDDHPNYIGEEFEITQADIDEAIAEWDKIMPEYKGMLNAKRDKKDNPAKE